MDLQSVFYVMGIIYMSLATIILLGIGIAMFYITKKIGELQKTVSQKVTTLTDIASHPGDLAADVGSAFVASAFKKAKKIVTKGE